MIIDHKLLVAIFKKDVTNRLQRILLRIHQYTIRILHKPVSQLFISDWLSTHNQETNRNEEIPGMCIAINAMESCMHISYCMTEE